MLRLAETRDASAIAAIFAPYAEASGISFAARAPTPAEWEKKIGELLPQFPFLVFEAGSVVTAYAYASPHRTLASYRWCCEVSIYVDATGQRRGAARALYTALIELLRLQGFHNAYAGIMLPNLASAALHEKFGFRHFATFERIGWKLGRWRDVGWWELKLQPEQGEDAPAEPRAFAAVQKEERASVSLILGR